MRRWVIVGFVGAMFSVASSPRVSAEEEMRPIAAAGNWVAVAHHASALAPADVCLAIEQDGHAALRAQDSDIEFRMMNNEWSLPADVKGTIVISISGKDTVLDIGTNTSVMVGAEVSKDQVLQLLDSMTKASSMIVKAGKDKPLSISLNGSNKVLSAFRTCAGIQGTSGGGTNPF